MIQTVAGKPTNRPPITLACQWEAHGLVLAHRNGLVSVFEGQRLLLSIQCLEEQIVHLRAVEQQLYVSCNSGLFCCYSLPLGILEKQVQLPGPVDGIFLQEQAVVVWGTGTQVLFLNRFSLDVIKTLDFDSKPVRVCRDKQLAIVLRSGQIYWVSDDCLSGPVMLPLDQYKFGPLVDAACIDVGKWVCVQRDRWSIVEQETEHQFALEFHASAPDLLQTLIISCRTSTFAITCDSSQVLLVENNNIQVLEPQWPAYALKSLVYSRNVPLAVVDSGVYQGHYTNQVWSWAKVSTCPFECKDIWLISGTFAANKCEFGTLDSECEFTPQYTAISPITCLWIDKQGAIFLGLENGSLITNLETETRALNTAIKFIARAGDGTIAVASTDAVALLYDLPVIVPVDAQINNIKMNDRMLNISTDCDDQTYNLETFELVPSGGSAFDVVPYTRVHEPFVQASIGPLVGFKSHGNVSLFSSDANERTAAAIYTIKSCLAGMSLAQADQELRKMPESVEQIENLLVLLNGENKDLCATATTLLQSLIDNKRIETLMQQGGIRPSLVFSAVYPIIPVGDWLTQSIDSLLGGNTTEQLVGLQILARHPELHEFPFKLLEKLGIKSAITRFACDAAANDSGLVTEALCQALTSELTYFSLCIVCITCIIEQRKVTISDAEFVRLIGAASRAVHRTPAGMSVVRKLFACILSIYPRDILFNKERQLLFVRQRAPDTVETFGVAWELQNGKQFTLAAPARQSHPAPQQESQSQSSQAEILTFSKDGKSIKYGPTKWHLPGAFASLFGSQQTIQPVSS